MNARCTICNSVISKRPGIERCPDCGARAEFQLPTSESPRHEGGKGPAYVWEFSPSGPVRKRIH